MGPKMYANFNTFEIAKLTKLKEAKKFLLYSKHCAVVNVFTHLF